MNQGGRYQYMPMIHRQHNKINRSDFAILYVQGKHIFDGYIKIFRLYDYYLTIILMVRKIYVSDSIFHINI